jgi:hypothetical protein
MSIRAFSPQYQEPLPRIKGIPERIYRYYPSAFYISGMNNPVAIGDHSHSQKEIDISVALWYKCLEDKDFLIRTPYCQDDPDNNTAKALQGRRRSSSKNSIDLFWVSLSSSLQITTQKVIDDLFHFPIDPRVNVIETTMDESYETLVDLYLPLYERFFLTTRRLLPPLSQDQILLSEIGQHEPVFRPLIDEFYLDFAERSNQEGRASPKPFNPTFLNQGEEKIRQQIGALNSDWVWIARSYLTKFFSDERSEKGSGAERSEERKRSEKGSRVERSDLKEILREFRTQKTIGETLDLLSQLPDREIKDLFGIDPPRHRGEFPHRLSFLSAWRSLAHKNGVPKIIRISYSDPSGSDECPIYF